MITKTRVIREYRLRADEIASLDSFELPNPHWKTGPRPMQLFLHQDVREAARRRYGSDEPYIVTLAQCTPAFIQWLIEDLDARARQLTPEQFENLVADRLRCLGLETQLVGSITRKDGGVDIVAYPRTPTVPFLVGVQVKHHRTNRKTGASDVRDFHGSLATQHSPFHLGVIVTNTAFTADARWFADQSRRLLRLRDLNDLRRWLHEDFYNDAEWREIPKRIELAPGVSIEIPSPVKEA